MIKRLIKWWIERNLPKRTGRMIIHSEHTGWGDCINHDGRRWYGWMGNMPDLGDIIEAQHKDGRTGHHLVTNVDYCMDPKDMFVADSYFLGYVDIKPLNVTCTNTYQDERTIQNDPNDEGFMEEEYGFECMCCGNVQNDSTGFGCDRCSGVCLEPLFF